MKIMTVGIDLAKNVFAVHGIDEHGKAVLVRPSVRREQFFSRYVVGWLVAGAENAGLAAALIEETCDKHGVERDTLILHSDRGSPMRAKTTAELLVDLGVAASLGFVIMFHS